MSQNVSEEQTLRSITPSRNGNGPEPFMRTDVGNAQRLVAQHGDDLRYVVPGGWHAYDGTRYAPDETGEVARRAKSIARGMIRDAAVIEDADERKRQLAHAIRTESEPRLRALTTLAASERRVVVRVDQLDADPMLFNTANGTIDLSSGELRPHDRDDLLTKRSPVVYDPDAACPLWDAFIERIFGGDADLIAYVNRVFGYCMTGLVREQVLPICWGAGANGKTTHLETIAHALGDYARHTPTPRC